MVIVSARTGQLGNQLFTFAHFVANSMENGYPVRNPAFYRYAKYFRSCLPGVWCGYPQSVRRQLLSTCSRILIYWVVWIVASISRFLPSRGARFRTLDISKSNDRAGTPYFLNATRFAEARESARIVFVRGWLFRDFESFQKHADSLRAFFRPIERHEHAVENLIHAARAGCDVLVGIHIRHGDYRQFADGRYFYTTDAYAKIMKRARVLWPSKHVRFLVCSNVHQDAIHFHDSDFVFGTGHTWLRICSPSRAATTLSVLRAHIQCGHRFTDQFRTTICRRRTINSQLTNSGSVPAGRRAGSRFLPHYDVSAT